MILFLKKVKKTCPAVCLIKIQNIQWRSTPWSLVVICLTPPPGSPPTSQRRAASFSCRSAPPLTSRDCIFLSANLSSRSCECSSSPTSPAERKPQPIRGRDWYSHLFIDRTFLMNRGKTRQTGPEPPCERLQQAQRNYMSSTNRAVGRGSKSH